MAIYNFKLPDIGEGIAEAEIVEWHVKVGDIIEEDAHLADMMTDKATVEMESPVAGKVVKLAGEVGDQIAIGSVLVEIETEGDVPEEEVEAPAAAEESEEEMPLGDGAEEPTPEQEKALPVTDRDEDAPVAKAESKDEGEDHKPATKVLASPTVRNRARDLGIDLSQVKTTSDRVRHADLDAYLLYNGGSVSHGGSAPRADEKVKVVGLRRKIAENMQAAKRRVPHFTLVEDFDVTALEETRAMMNRDRGNRPKLTVLPFLIAAMAKTLPDFPMLNATYDDEANEITRHGKLHMGMAAQTDNGLMVPVIKDAHAKSVWQLASDIGRLAEEARSGKIARDELQGATITLSSLGPMGGITSTPVIMPPQVAIIAVNKMQEIPIIEDGELVAAKKMNLSLSCDHRVVDGWDAASFLQALKGYIENPIRLLSA
ncbi:dihydrolipoamide acetyltransferase family protein [Sphingomicrobium lutaoense]|uniref:Dihydrolipoamide acetyltransferase component of pyruvate dehydrogenase complex n=1 Tax=Sphingomicrobium lutaoense TaxID=515949 RepID=A0A839YVW4_9SPHN|nr:dihydrolipoamide acetyltransferase family protein [Sphingomicrobium lutaoense]MBB3763166.1 2-oxoisovalerate dehydrogenase E2 component (dihydrolipoyl transacylase) [Sphingomicrobium lutaoense]